MQGTDGVRPNTVFDTVASRNATRAREKYLN